MAEAALSATARMIVDDFVDQQNDSDLETAFGPDRAAPVPALQRQVAEHAAQEGLPADDSRLIAAVRAEFARRCVSRPA